MDDAATALDVAIDWEEVPLDYNTEDEIPEEWRDHDNSLLAATAGHGLIVPMADAKLKALVALQPPPPKVLVVPYRGETKPGAKGPHVVAYKRAISRAEPKIYGWRKTFTLVYGPDFKKAVIAFQKAKKLNADGVIGPLTHKAIARYFQAFEQQLYASAQIETNPNAIARGKVLSYTAFLYNNRAAIHYTEGPLRMYGLRNHIIPPHVTPYEDCSSMFKYVSWISGLPSPDHLGYGQPYGFTGTMIEAGTKIMSAAETLVGDAAFYGGSWIPGHVAMVIGNGASRVFSHGSEIGPLILPSGYRADNPFHPYVRYAK